MTLAEAILVLFVTAAVILVAILRRRTASRDEVFQAEADRFATRGESFAGYIDGEINPVLNEADIRRAEGAL